MLGVRELEKEREWFLRVVRVRPYLVVKNGKVYLYGRCLVNLPSKYIGKKVKLIITVDSVVEEPEELSDMYKKFVKYKLCSGLGNNPISEDMLESEVRRLGIEFNEFVRSLFVFESGKAYLNFSVCKEVSDWL